MDARADDGFRNGRAHGQTARKGGQELNGLRGIWNKGRDKTKSLPIDICNRQAFAAVIRFSERDTDTSCALY